MRKPLRPEISSFLWKLTDDPKILRLLELSLGRVLDNAAARGEFATGLVNPQQAAHIRDWLAAATANDEQWLKTTDHEGRPRKLLKFGSVEAITAEADKAMRKFAQKNRAVILEEGSEELYAELEDGHYVVRLLTPEALDRESGEMRHCIGQGAYDNRVGTEHYDYLSLRDRFGKARLTIELDLRPARGLSSSSATASLISRPLLPTRPCWGQCSRRGESGPRRSATLSTTSIGSPIMSPRCRAESSSGAIWRYEASTI